MRRRVPVSCGSRSLTHHFHRFRDRSDGQYDVGPGGGQHNRFLELGKTLRPDFQGIRSRGQTGEPVFARVVRARPLLVVGVVLQQDQHARHHGAARIVNGSRERSGRLGRLPVQRSQWNYHRQNRRHCRPTKAPAQPVAVAACVEQCAHTLLQVRSCRHAEGRGVSARMRHGPRQAYQVLRVCGLLRSRSHHRVVARALLFAAEARGRQPRQRTKPIQCHRDSRHQPEQWISAPRMRQFVQ